MKAKKLLLMAAMLLMSMCIFAQNNMVGAIPSWKNIVLNSDMEGNDVSCFFKTENLTEDDEAIPATIISGAGMDNSRGIVIQSVDAPSETWNTQFFVRLPMALPVGTKYRMSFDYKASQDAQISMEVHDEPHEYINWYFDWGSGDMVFTSSWQHFECEGIVSEEMNTDENMMRTIAFDLAYEPSATLYYFDNIVFEIDQAQWGQPSVTITTDDITHVEDLAEIIVKKKESMKLKAIVYPLSLEDKSVKWDSSDESVATVSSSGVVKGIKSGMATITCTSVSTGLSATCKVTVGTITLNKKEVSINKGKTLTLKPSVYPTTLEDLSVTWESSDMSVATVSSAGKVKGIKPGTATIICTSNATGLSATCTVNVNIDFADANVKAICVNYWDTNDDGELSPAEAAAVTDLGYVFQGNDEITSFNELQYFTGITEIREGSFNPCTSLSSIIIPAGVTHLEGSAFSNCPKLNMISVNPYNSVYDSRNDCNAVIETATNKLVQGCGATQIPDGITTIGYDAFGGMWEMQEMTIPATVTTLEDLAFSHCISMTSFILPAGIKTIGDDAFVNCHSLTDIWCYAKTPVAITEGVFTDRANATLHVLEGCKAAYAAADYWKEFKDINVITEGTEGVPTWKNIILNSDLEGDDVSCFFKTENLAEDDEAIPATISDGAGIDNSRGLMIQSVDDATESWNTQFFVRLPQALPAGTKYRMSFDYKASQDAYVKMEVHGEPHEYLDWSFDWGYGDMNCTSSWQHFECEGIVTEQMSHEDNMMRSIAFDLANEPSATLYYFDNIVFEIDQTQWEQPSVTITTDNMTSVDDLSEIIVRKKNSINLKAIVCPLSLKDKSVKWKSSDKSIATVSSDGVVTGVKSGVVTIICTSVFTGLSATCQVTVGTISLNKSSVTVNQGKTVTLKPTVYPTSLEDQSVTWESSDESVATVTSAGKVKGVKAGVATITCTSNATGLSATCTVTVPGVALDQSEVILKKKKTLTLTPTFYPETLEDKSVTWKSSDKTIATVSSSGKVTGVKSGVVTITCTSVATGAKATCKVTVGTITLNKSSLTITEGKKVTLKPTIYPTTLEDQSVTWKSSNKAVATVSKTGKVKAIAAGTATITCTSVATGLSTTCKVTVKAASARTIDGDDDELTDIEIVEVTPAVVEPFDVYDLRGHRVLHQVTSLDALPAGVYIVKGKKVLKK